MRLDGSADPAVGPYRSFPRTRSRRIRHRSSAQCRRPGQCRILLNHAHKPALPHRSRPSWSRIVPALRNACELRTLRRVELTLLNTYVGATTARRVMAGHIRRGDLETLEAGLMLCDLRGFTELSNRLPGGRVLELLNAYFDLVVPAITHAGGEVIKVHGRCGASLFPSRQPRCILRGRVAGRSECAGRLGPFHATRR